MKNNVILNHQEIKHKIRRIAYQIYETFVDDPSIVIAGIGGNGFVFAGKIAEELQSISHLKVLLCEVKINKNKPKDPISSTLNRSDIDGKGLILVDDVLNSGTTLIYGVRYFLDFTPSKFKTAVLVDRNHKQYPVKADFKGISLSTSLKDHVQVVFQSGDDHAYLS